MPSCQKLLVIALVGVWISLVFPTMRHFSTHEFISNARYFYRSDVPDMIRHTIERYNMTHAPVVSTLYERLPVAFDRLDTSVFDQANAKLHTLILGTDLYSAIERAKEINTDGYHVLINLGGEHYDGAHIRECLMQVADYIELVELIAHERINASVSIKPSGIGMDVNPEVFERNLLTIAEFAAPLGVRIEVDVEEKAFRDATVDGVLRVLAAVKNYRVRIRVAHQAEFTDSVHVAEKIAAAGGSLRLVRGKAYAGDSASESTWSTEDELQAAFIACAKACPHDLALATGISSLIDQVVEAIDHPVETQFLLGLPWHVAVMEAQRDLGRAATVYAPIGPWKSVEGYVRRRNVMTEEEIEALEGHAAMPIDVDAMPSDIFFK